MFTVAMTRHIHQLATAPLPHNRPVQVLCWVASVRPTQPAPHLPRLPGASDRWVSFHTFLLLLFPALLVLAVNPLVQTVYKVELFSWGKDRTAAIWCSICEQLEEVLNNKANRKHLAWDHYVMINSYSCRQKASDRKGSFQGQVPVEVCSCISAAFVNLDGRTKRQ